MSLHWALLLLAATGVLATTQSGNSQAALDTGANPASDPAPAELVPVSSENHRFSRLLKDSANVLQFSSISNDAPPIWGVARDGKKKEGKAGKKTALAGPNFGRRSLDYDEQLQQGFEQTTSETRIVANPYPGNEYVFVHPGKIVETPTDSDIAASVTSINNKPPRVPLALLRQKKGKRVNISPLFTEVPQVHHDSADATKEFVWVDQPVEHRVFVGVNRQGRNHDAADDATTNPAFPVEDIVEATTLADEQPLETTTLRHNNKSKLIVNVVTSAPRVSVESNVQEKKKTRPRKTQSTTTVATTVTTESTTFSTTHVPTTVPPPVLSSSSPKATTADDKENLVTDAFHRAGSSFQGFEDSQTKLQTAESNQPARVNVRPAQNGKEYEYEYIYYYYDDDDTENAEKTGEGKTGDTGKAVKSNAAATSTASSAAPVSSDSAASTASVSSTTTTSTTTIAPEVSSADADFEYEDDVAIDEEPLKVSAAPELRKNTPTVSRTEEEPIHKGVSSAEKLSNSNPINQLDRSRSPKSSPGKFDEAVADYKLETEASQEEEVIEKAHQLSKGQPQSQDPLSEENEEETFDEPAPVAFQPVANEPSTASPGLSSTSGVETDHMSTLAKTHKDSVNVPIVLKQSSLLKAVPVSQLHSQQAHHLPEENPSTVPVTVPTTTTTIESASEVVPSVRPAPQRVRGGQRFRGSITPRPAVQTVAETAPQQPAVEEKPAQAVRRPNFREGSRRIPSRRPVTEAAAEAPIEQQPVASPVHENHARPVATRPRFPPRSGTTTTTAAPVVPSVADAVPATISGSELNSLDDTKSKDAQVRAKSASDLFAFARLQQAIGSRAPSRIPPKLVGGFVNSAEATTDAITSSEVTTVSSLGGQSGETLVSAEPSTTTTTTTTTEAPLPGRQRGGAGPRFGGRQRKPLGGNAGAATSTTTTEAPTTRGRFNGGRRRPSTTASPEAAPTSSAGTSSTDDAKPKIPSRNRFATRNRSTTEASVSADQNAVESDKPSTTQPRRRPTGSFQGRRRPNQVQGQTDAATTPEETGSTSADTAGTTVSTTAAPTTPGRTRFNFAAGGGRPRPGAAAAAPATSTGNNPIRIRGGGRLRGPTTSTTTESVPAEDKPEEPVQEQNGEPEQSQSIQSENLEQPIQNAPAPESVAPARGSGGVLGRLKNRPKLVATTTTVAPEPAGGDRKPSRLNGILNRRKNIGQLPGGAHVKEEVKETPSEAAEEASNHAQEQDDDHKGVVVQVSSSVTESEEVNAAQASEVVETPSTTPGSILNRLKSQRKPGSIFRKKPDPHGE